MCSAACIKDFGVAKMAENRVHITLGCTVCKNKNYHFARGKKQEYKLEIKKFCRKCGKQTPHKEVKN